MLIDNNFQEYYSVHLHSNLKAVDKGQKVYLRWHMTQTYDLNDLSFFKRSKVWKYCYFFQFFEIKHCNFYEPIENSWFSKLYIWDLSLWYVTSLSLHNSAQCTRTLHTLACKQFASGTIYMGSERPPMLHCSFHYRLLSLDSFKILKRFCLRNAHTNAHRIIVDACACRFTGSFL